MFRKLSSKKQAGGQYDAHAVGLLQMVDAAIQQIHPDRFPSGFDVMPYVNPRRIVMNTFLGRPTAERFFPLEYEALVARILAYAQRGVLEDAMRVAQQDATMNALMRGISHECKLRYVMKQAHDQRNLGKEVENSTKTLIQLLNRGAGTRPEPMPGN